MSPGSRFVSLRNSVIELSHHGKPGNSGSRARWAFISRNLHCGALALPQSLPPWPLNVCAHSTGMKSRKCCLTLMDWLILSTWVFSASCMVDVSWCVWTRERKIVTSYSFSCACVHVSVTDQCALDLPIFFLPNPLFRKLYAFYKCMYILNSGYFSFHTEWISRWATWTLPIRTIFFHAAS